MYKPRLIGYIVRRKVSPSLILCTDGQWHWHGVVGISGQYSAKIYKTKAGAKKVLGGQVIIEEQWV